MVQVILIVMFAIFAHTAHGACYSGSYNPYSGNTNLYCKADSRASANVPVCSSTPACSGGRFSVSGNYYTNCYVNYNGRNACNFIEWATSLYYDITCRARCTTQCEADSLACVNRGEQWDSQNCECKVCTESDTTFKESSCAYDPQQGKYLNIVNTITRTDCEVTVKEDKYYALTCDTTCNANSELTCMGSIDGVNVYLRSCNGKVVKCEADGSCDAAIRKVASGECENPNSPPNGNNSSSSSEQGSSSSGGNAADSLGWLKDSLRVIHVTDSVGFAEVNNNLENMQPFVAGTYDQVTDIAGTVHDINSNLLTGFEFLNDIKENTGNTANNTNNINNKLTNTNQLLTDLNNKNWNVTVRPEITVEGDTNIINVQTDTAKSGAAILDFLKGIFKGADTTNNYNPNDTAGTGHVIDSLMGKIGELDSDSGYLTVRDSVGVAVTSMRGSYNALKDTLAHSAINDSMNRWSEAITNNGVIQGNGSDNCPSILNTPFNVKIGTIDYTTTKTIGMYLCTPISPFNVTLWTLARVIIRAIVSISCMIWLYKTVLGIDGGSNEED